jgi:hypothetical protein
MCVREMCGMCLIAAAYTRRCSFALPAAVCVQLESKEANAADNAARKLRGASIKKWKEQEAKSREEEAKRKAAQLTEMEEEESKGPEAEAAAEKSLAAAAAAAAAAASTSAAPSSLRSRNSFLCFQPCTERGSNASAPNAAAAASPAAAPSHFSPPASNSSALTGKKIFEAKKGVMHEMSEAQLQAFRLEVVEAEVKAVRGKLEAQRGCRLQFPAAQEILDIIRPAVFQLKAGSQFLDIDFSRFLDVSKYPAQVVPDEDRSAAAGPGAGPPGGGGGAADGSSGGAAAGPGAGPPGGGGGAADGSSGGAAGGGGGAADGSSGGAAAGPGAGRAAAASFLSTRRWPPCEEKSTRVGPKFQVVMPSLPGSESKTELERYKRSALVLAGDELVSLPAVAAAAPSSSSNAQLSALDRVFQRIELDRKHKGLRALLNSVLTEFWPTFNERWRRFNPEPAHQYTFQEADKRLKRLFYNPFTTFARLQEAFSVDSAALKALRGDKNPAHFEQRRMRVPDTFLSTFLQNAFLQNAVSDSEN